MRYKAKTHRSRWRKNYSLKHQCKFQKHLARLINTQYMLSVKNMFQETHMLDSQREGSEDLSRKAIIFLTVNVLLLNALTCSISESNHRTALYHTLLLNKSKSRWHLAASRVSLARQVRKRDRTWRLEVRIKSLSACPIRA
jgi:hypothetical protein